MIWLSIDIMEKKNPILPFSLTQLQVSNYLGIKQLDLTDLPADASWIFLTGENGFGKTSILKAIAKGLVGDEDFVEPLPVKTKLSIHGYRWGQPCFYEARSKKLAPQPFQMAGYGAARFRLSSMEEIDLSQTKINKKTYSLFYDDGLLLHIERLLKDAERDDLPLFNRLKAIFLQLIPHLADIKSEVIAKKRRICYYEKSEDGKLYPPVLLHELAAGYRGILTTIGDMVQRLSEHPDNSLDDLQGIVLIDEFDAHLHPKYQYELPRLLSQVFPKIQFIVTIHSPIPLLSLPASVKSVVLTVSRTVEQGIFIQNKTVQYRRLHPNALLTSPIFGLDTMFAPDTEPDDMIAADDYSEVERMEQIKIRLKSLKAKGFIQ
jgi:predicted ATP-binding protein involved in virulence